MSFTYNFENNDNTFAVPVSDSGVQRRVLDEFDRMAAQLDDLGLNVLLLEDSSASPDAIFPNNWLSTHADGRLVLYPMKAPSRRKEVNPEIATFFRKHGFYVHQTLDWTHYTEQSLYLEGTGSLVIDWQQRHVYAALSERTHPDLVALFADTFQLEACMFEAASFAGPDGALHAIYHSNVMMAFAQDTVIWVPEGIANQKTRENLFTGFKQTKKHQFELSLDQMHCFMANSLQVSRPEGLVLLMSAKAKNHLPANFIQALSQVTQICFFDIPTIEQVGGGSVRCMLTEVFLPHSQRP